MDSSEAAAERKRKRLEAWRKRQQSAQQQQTITTTNDLSARVPPPPPPPPTVKVSLSLNSKATKKLKSKKIKKKTVGKSARSPSRSANPFGVVDDDDDFDGNDSDNEGKRGTKKLGLGFIEFSNHTNNNGKQNETEGQPSKRRKRWDDSPAAGNSKPVQQIPEGEPTVGDALDKFMDKLEAGALGTIATQVGAKSDGISTDMLSIDVGGSMMRVSKQTPQNPKSLPISGGIITSDEITQLSIVTKNLKPIKLSKAKQANPDAFYTPSDWESGVSEAETDDDDKVTNIESESEDKARRAFIEALKSATASQPEEKHEENETQAVLAAEVKSEKSRREQKFKDLKREAETARSMAEKLSAPEIGRLYNDIEGGVMEEAERNLDAAMAAPDALQVLAELNKKKELKSVDHSKVDYIPFKKNLYIVPRDLAKLSSDEIANLRGKLKVKVRGRGAPAPVSSFEQCGLSERIIALLEKNNILTPFPIQAQCIPCIMVSRCFLIVHLQLCNQSFLESRTSLIAIVCLLIISFFSSKLFEFFGNVRPEGM